MVLAGTSPLSGKHHCFGHFQISLRLAALPIRCRSPDSVPQAARGVWRQQLHQELEWEGQDGGGDAQCSFKGSLTGGVLRRCNLETSLALLAQRDRPLSS